MYNVLKDWPLIIFFTLGKVEVSVNNLLQNLRPELCHDTIKINLKTGMTNKFKLNQNLSKEL